MVDFSEREKELMALAWQCFEEEPKIQFPKLAQMAGMTNAGSASNAWRNIKKKLSAIAAQNGGTGGDGEVPSTPKATPKRKKKATGEDLEDGETPAKKPKATPRKKAKKAAAEDSADQDDEAESSKVKAEAEASDGDDLV